MVTPLPGRCPRCARWGAQFEALRAELAAAREATAKANTRAFVAERALVAAEKRAAQNRANTIGALRRNNANPAHLRLLK